MKTLVAYMTPKNTTEIHIKEQPKINNKHEKLV